MTYLEVKNQLKDYPIFSTRDIEMIDPTFHKQRLSEWQERGYIRQIRRGYYVFEDREQNEPTLFAIAGEIYKPSYVSLEMVLSLHGLIPESVYEITSVTSRKTKTFQTSVATFKYRHVMPKLMFGYHPQENKDIRYLIADMEKAALDFLYLNPDIDDIEDLKGLRFNTSEFRNKVDMEKLHRYIDAFENQALRKRMQSLLTYTERYA